MRRLSALAVLAACSPTDLAAPTGDGTGTAGVQGALSKVVVNELMAGTSGFIELYNASASAVDVGGWQVDDIADGGKAPKVLPAGTVVPAKGFLSVAYSGVNTASADEVRLLDASGAIVDTHDNGWDGASTAGQCFGRSPDGGSWAGAPLLCSPGASNAATPGGDADVRVNEFLAGAAGWIELYNADAAAADVSGWAVDDTQGGTAPKTLPAGTQIPGQGFLRVPYGGINTASADEVRVLDAGSAVIDALANGYAGTSLSGKCFGRSPDGGPVATEPLACSGGAPNGATNTPPPAGSVVINEHRAGASGWIELYNPGGATVALEGWMLDDVAGAGAAPKTLPAGTTLGPKAFAYVTYTGINTASADDVRLVSPGGAVVDSHTNGWAGSSIAASCFARSPDGGPWAPAAAPCSPGAPNAASAPSAQVRINEFGPGDGGFVEFINVGATTVDLTGWAVDDAAGGSPPVPVPSGTLLPPGGLSYVGLGTVSALSADEVRLLDASGKVVDARKNYVGEDPCPATCYGRIPNGGAWAPYGLPCSGGSSNPAEPVIPCLPGSACDDNSACTSGNVCSDTCVCGKPVTCNDQNPCTLDHCPGDATACQYYPLADGTSCGAGLTCGAGECRNATTGPKLVLNEISAGPDGWVEVVNVGQKPAYLPRYQLWSSLGAADVATPWDPHASLAAGARVAVPYAALSATALDAVTLSRNGEVLDTVPNRWTQGSTAGLCFARRPDTTGPFVGTPVACTRGTSNGGALTVCPVGGTCDDGNACTTGETFDAACTCKGGAPVDCNDGSTCTTDTCDALMGCRGTPTINFESCGGTKVCIAGVCKTEPACSAPGGTYKSVTFTKAEECAAVSFMNKARYSQMNDLPAFARNQIYDCDPVTKACGGRTSRWTTLAELIVASSTAPIGTTSLNALKAASKGYVPSGKWYDTVANTWTDRTALSGRFIGLEKAVVTAMVGTSCAIIRDAAGAPNSLTMCAQYCYADAPCDGIPPLGAAVSVRGRLVYAQDFAGGPRWILTAATTGAPNPAF